MLERRSFPQVETFHGDGGPYLTRVAFTGSHCLHVFHRGDADEDPHDHKRAFWTLPLVSYVEEVYVQRGHEGWTDRRVVHAGRPQFRDRRFIHRLIGKWSGQRDRLTGAPIASTVDGEVVTLVWWVGRARETWGFWCWPKQGLRVRRGFVDWRAYLEDGVRRHA